MQSLGEATSSDASTCSNWGSDTGPIPGAQTTPAEIGLPPGGTSANATLRELVPGQARNSGLRAVLQVLSPGSLGSPSCRSGDQRLDDPVVWNPSLFAWPRPAAGARMRAAMRARAPGSLTTSSRPCSRRVRRASSAPASLAQARSSATGRRRLSLLVTSISPPRPWRHLLAVSGANDTDVIRPGRARLHYVSPPWADFVGAHPSRDPGPARISVGVVEEAT